MKTPTFAAQTRTDSPFGPLTLAATERGLALLWFDLQAHRTAEVKAPVNAGHPHLQQAVRELQAYWTTPQLGFTVALDPQGTEFQQAVWRALRGISTGQLSTYGSIARAVGRPDASRAVGAAIGRNPIGIIVPCHRVVGADGSLTGYAGGLARKQALLAREGAISAELLAQAAA